MAWRREERGELGTGREKLNKGSTGSILGPETWALKPNGIYVYQEHWSLIFHLSHLKGLFQVSFRVRGK